MELREITRQVISALEEKSGYPVQLLEEPKLTTLASLRVARGEMPAHILMYKVERKNELPDYAICLQCTLLMRMYDCPPEKRFLIGGSPAGIQALDRILNAPGGLAQTYRMKESHVQGFIGELLAGLITHLRSVPLALRVSESLSLDYPELLDLETGHVERELQINRESLSAQIRAMMPAAVYDPTQTINAAYALYWAGRLEEPKISNPYHLEGFDRGGRELLKLYESTPADPERDTELIDRWADYLRIRDWYAWLSYQAP
ncbi:MAG: hypothetical protein JW963_01440 [Anaerolineales bacterium]|nr:hypothetical protein [Anaerolineales bacterium]